MERLMEYKFLYQKWWKIIGLLILLYVFIAGFLVPLRPGIMDISDYKLYAGNAYSIDVSTYNTHLNKPGKELEAYIKYDSAHLTKVPYVMVTDRTSLNIRGVLPEQMPTKDKLHEATLIIHDSDDGYLLLPSAFTIDNSEKNPIASASEANWDAEINEFKQEWTFRFPFVAILYETIRNMFFHVAIWMAMFVLLVVSLVYSIYYLRSSNIVHDAIAASFAHVAIGLGTIGIITGSVWAKATWGTYWTDDPKLNMSAVAMMIYLAYSILRASMNDDDKRAKICAAFNIFAFVAMIPLIFIIPRLSEVDSLHPGNGGNPALGGQDLDSTLRLVFYPAIIGYTLLGLWVSAILFRIRRLEIYRINKKLNS